MKATAYAEITPLDPEWLWPGRIPRSQTTIIAGDGGIGKGFLMADIAARVTRGAPMPDGSGGGTSGSVIFVSLEDDPNMAMAHRLRAAGADLSKVYDFSDGFQWGCGPRDSGDSLPELRENIEAIGDVHALIIDPLSAASGISINSGTQKIRRQLMMPMDRICKDSGIASIVIAHTIKDRRTIAGSKAITDAARMVLRVSCAESDPQIRLIHVEKTNIASGQSGDVAYRVGGQFPDVRVEYLAVPEDSIIEKPPTVAQLVLLHLADVGTPVETQKIAQAVNQGYGAVRVALTRLKADDKVQNPARGLWALAPQLPPSLEVVK